MTQSSDTVVSLACARFEDALAEGIMDSSSEAHADQCRACRDLADLIWGDQGVVAATASVPLSPGFVDQVLERALSETTPLQRIRPATDDLRVAELEAALERRRQRTTWVAAAALVAGLLVAAGVYSALGAGNGEIASPRSPEAAPVSKAATQPEAPLATAAPTPAPAAGDAVTATKPKPAAAAPKRVVEPPKPNISSAVPEPVVDIPGEIRELLVRKIRAHAGCPKRNRAPVRVTLTLGADGSVTSPQVLSQSGNARAHQCVSYALDRLLIGPQERSVTVTLDLVW